MFAPRERGRQASRPARRRGVVFGGREEPQYFRDGLRVRRIGRLARRERAEGVVQHARPGQQRIDRIRAVGRPLRIDLRAGVARALDREARSVVARERRPRIVEHAAVLLVQRVQQVLGRDRAAHGRRAGSHAALSLAGRVGRERRADHAEHRVAAVRGALRAGLRRAGRLRLGEAGARLVARVAFHVDTCA